MNDIENGGIIYVLTNDAMPNIIKIGRTSGEGVERRVAELSRATGVPLPFKVAVARTVHDAKVVERALHIAFGPDRVNPAREFFAIHADRAIALINAFPGDDLTPQTERAVEREVEASEPGTLAAAERYERRRRPPLNFIEMGVPIGSTLSHVLTGEEVEVVEPKRVRFRGEIVSLTKAQQIVSGAAYAVAPGQHWAFEGVTISVLYDATYPFLVED
ncbi:GIY-YIG nuclease family protein [Microvirga sp. SRT01]|uniref:GIY-YIG nuclease family protein n=1 Tax=Sphingomonas longa TaxID=2778730 RepID=A0ABS2DCS2_9SPHN|nr:MULTISPECIES: GIY-YIG nuclease family protein [Alphaproteobacteria]MBM6577874.1 GIY-YIG nuclease family protein [Sphingomonas sp. BT552]MBR7710915.1 GIY-YIG nuclease family protein [Microvirga sp. SRT01]